MFEASFDGTDRTTVESLLARGPQFLKKLVDTMNVLAFKLQSHIVTDKLNGQVLHHRKGILAGSIRVTPAAVDSSSSIGAEVLGGGGVAWYGRVHEYGGDGPYVIEATNKKALRFMVGGKVVFAKRVNHPPLPMRSFMRSSLDDQRAEIAERLQLAMNEASA
jgi:hypothetical protein